MPWPLIHNHTSAALNEFTKPAKKQVKVACTEDTTTVHFTDEADAKHTLEEYIENDRHIYHLINMGITDIQFDIQREPLPHVCTREVPAPNTSLLFEAYRTGGPVHTRVGTEMEQEHLWKSMQTQMRTHGHQNEPVRLDTLHKALADGQKFVMHAIFSDTVIRNLAFKVLSQAPLKLRMRLDDIHGNHTCRPRAEELPMLVKPLLIEGANTKKQPLQSQGAAKK